MKTLNDTFISTVCLLTILILICLAVWHNMQLPIVQRDALSNRCVHVVHRTFNCATVEGNRYVLEYVKSE